MPDVTKFEALDDFLAEEVTARAKARAKERVEKMARRYPRVAARLRAYELAEKTDKEQSE